ncbi:hypothetical protein, partial [Streptomyces cinereoruber]|uniref:hypothetical protein n=1 Tax=Streptomyces cinereoruber TaxID=67260 RepID=UPI0036409896
MTNGNTIAICTEESPRSPRARDRTEAAQFRRYITAAVLFMPDQMPVSMPLYRETTTAMVP